MLFRTMCTLLVSLTLLANPVGASDVVDLAASLIGRPYVWGAEGPRSFDCSGLMQYVYGEFGHSLPRRAIDQSRTGDTAGRRLQRGDLIFFSTDTRRSLVTHVGIYEGRGLMVNASKSHGRVRRDDLNDEYWSARYMFARRVLGSGNVARRGEPEPEREAPRRTERGTDARREAGRALGRLIELLGRRVPR